jgi:hypothetical protein
MYLVPNIARGVENKIITPLHNGKLEEENEGTMFTTHLVEGATTSTISLGKKTIEKSTKKIY